MYEHDFVSIFAGYWWLLFPLGWGVSALIQSWQRSRRAEKAMEIIKGYADQGKAPPPEVLALLQPEARSADPVVSAKRDRDRTLGFLIAALVFVALSVAFGVLMSATTQAGDHNHAGLLFVSVLMGGFAVAFFIAAFVSSRHAKKDGM